MEEEQEEGKREEGTGVAVGKVVSTHGAVHVEGDDKHTDGSVQGEDMAPGNVGSMDVDGSGGQEVVHELIKEGKGEVNPVLLPVITDGLGKRVQEGEGGAGRTSKKKTGTYKKIPNHHRSPADIVSAAGRKGGGMKRLLEHGDEERETAKKKLRAKGDV